MVLTQDDLYIKMCDHFTLRWSEERIVSVKLAYLTHFKMDWDMLYINKEGFEFTRRWCRLRFGLKRFMGGWKGILVILVG